MTDAFPLFIGITGKRQLAKNPAQAGDAEQKVRERLAAVSSGVIVLVTLSLVKAGHALQIAAVNSAQKTPAAIDKGAAPPCADSCT